MTVQIAQKVKIITGTLLFTCSGKINSKTPGATSYGSGEILLGFTICVAIIPNTKAPIPRPEITTPDTNPFLPGKWLQPASRGAGYRKPFPTPNPTAYNAKKAKI